MAQAFAQKQFWRFLAAGAVAAAANFGSRFAFSLWLRYEWAIVAAYLTGMTVAFLLMRGLVFPAATRPLWRQVAMFTLINILALLQTLAVSELLYRWVLPALGIISAAEAIAHLAGVMVPVATSYFGHRILTFR